MRASRGRVTTLDAQRLPAPTSDVSLVDALFRPRSIALVGASADPAKHSALPQKHLMQHGYAGRLFPINPRRTEIFGVPAYPSIGEVPQRVDHAYVMLPTDAVQQAVEECVAAQVRCVTIMSNGYAEAGDAGRARQDRLLATIRGSETRLLGPNALGVVDLHAKVALSGNEVLSLPELRAGSLGLISQSGSMLGAILSRGQARGLGFSKLASVGNESDISIAELIEIMADDPETSVILLFLETIRQPERLRSAALRAHRAGKPVLAYRLGRSSIGQQLAVSHTGAMVGSGRAVEVFLHDVGIAELRNFEALLDAPLLFRGRHPTSDGGRDVSRHGLGVMTTTGGGGALVVDNLGSMGIPIQAPTAGMRSALAAEGIAVDDAPLVDLTLAGTNPRTYGAVLRAFMASDAIHAMVCVVGSSSQFRPERAVAPIVDACAGDGMRKPLAVFLTPDAQRSRDLLLQAGIPVFSQPEACADAFRALLAWRAPAERPAPTGVQQDPSALGRFAAGTTLNSADSQALFGAIGIAQADEWLLDPDPAAWDDATLERLSYPCALKVVSTDIPHKTEAGGVALGVADAASLRDRAVRMAATVEAYAPGARIEGFQVQPMTRGLAEVLVGLTRDPAVGPVVSVGMGGVLAELYHDVSIRPAPVSLRQANEMLDEVKGLAQLRGYRNLPLGDLGALADAVVKVSNLARLEHPAIAEAEINPLMVLPVGNGVRAIDGLVVLRR